MTTLSELASALEGAEKGSRELDFALHALEMGDWLRENGYRRDGDIYRTNTPPFRGAEWAAGPASYSSSLDAAIALVEAKLPEWRRTIQYRHTFGAWVELWNDEVGLSATAERPTEPLAICTALIRALMAKENDNG